MIASALGIVLGITVAILITIFGITGLINRMSAVMDCLAAYETSAMVEGTERKDELGSIVAAVKVFKDNILRTRALEEETALGSRQRRGAAQEGNPRHGR